MHEYNKCVKANVVMRKNIRNLQATQLLLTYNVGQLQYIQNTPFYLYILFFLITTESVLSVLLQMMTLIYFTYQLLFLCFFFFLLHIYTRRMFLSVWTAHT